MIFLHTEKRELMELLPLKIAPFYTFLIGSYSTGDFHVCQRSACSVKEFQAGEQVAPEYWCCWTEVNLTIPPRVLHNTEENLLQAHTEHWHNVGAYSPNNQYSPGKSLRFLKDQTLRPFLVFGDFLPSQIQPLPCGDKAFVSMEDCAQGIHGECSTRRLEGRFWYRNSCASSSRGHSFRAATEWNTSQSLSEGKPKASILSCVTTETHVLKMLSISPAPKP